MNPIAYIKTNLTDEQKITLQKIFQQGFAQPHVVAQQLHLKRVEAIALLDRLVQEYPEQFTRRYLVYHSCSEAHVDSMSDTKTVKQGYICPECEEEVEMDHLTLDFAYRAIAPVDFMNPDDGLVRYWGIDHFPYYSKTCRDNPEPILVLARDDANYFDGIVEGETARREKTLLRLEQDFWNTLSEVAEDLINGNLIKAISAEGARGV